MKNSLLFYPLGACCIMGLSSWGFYAHKRINNLAVFTLPSPLAGFYKAHLYYITDHAIDPDKRCYVDTAESSRHYIDADRYGDHPFDSIPHRWKEAATKYSEARLQKDGIVPWQIDCTYHYLVKAFSEGDLKHILRHSADLGHYIGDAHVPLHTTSNYNGQATNQVGIHAFWESRIPEAFADRFNFFVGRAHYIGNALDTAWAIVAESHRLLDSVYTVESELNKRFSPDRKYAFVERNKLLVHTYSDEYTRAYHQALRGMVERRMRSAVKMVGCYWYSAWIDAGQPDISKLQAQTKEDRNKIPEEDLTGKKILGREEWR
ncbi:hypothetical protein SAMN05216436_10634 [bacterium A37T11]|nr:hypothetical protein SAMN05216436_10634 [bacterium A37T11]